MAVSIMDSKIKPAEDMYFSASTPSTAATTHHPTPNYEGITKSSCTRFDKNWNNTSITGRFRFANSISLNNS